MQDIPIQDLTRAGQPNESLGERLARVREARGLTVREAAMRLAIDPAVLEALEAERFQELGAPIYVRGYLVRYARLLELPEQPLVEAYRNRAPAEPPPLKPTANVTVPGVGRRWGARWLGYLLLLAGVAWVGWLGLQEVSLRQEAFTDDQPGGSSGLALPRPQNNGGSPPAGLPLPTAETLRQSPTTESDKPPAESATTAAQPSPARPAVPSTPDAPLEAPQVETLEASIEEGFPVEPVPAETPEKLPVEAPAEAPPAEAAPSGGETPEVPAGEARLVMSFSADCWVDVKDAENNRLAYGIMKANTVHTLTGPAPFSLVLGNAQAVSLTINGQPIASDRYVPSQGTVARVVLEAPTG
ncbi:MAG: RodZ family helix-turn-helix domain-containing protein [Candidatus Competibacteraceae bacterium]|nr:RodZ family helix-turn-helix domain-containing protein [Candidatus Competibacteraceae bacterium]